VSAQFAVSFERVIWFLRLAVLGGPAVAFLVTISICRALRVGEVERRRDGAETGEVVRLPSGGYVERHRPGAGSGGAEATADPHRVDPGERDRPALGRDLAAVTNAPQGAPRE
jgi:ubiquinol-cytochrome c reductase cytochrome b subunit